MDTLSLPHANTFGQSGDPHMWQVTRAVRHWWETHGEPAELCVALSGGADSLALTAGAIRTGAAVTALIIDHQLQENSAHVAARAAQQARDLGCQDAHIIPITVTDPQKQGMEAAARTLRYAALDEHRAGRPVLLGHTEDDQAETLLLGLLRGSGPRAIAGMSSWDDPWGRPLLTVPRSTTRAACAEHQIDYWDDPHNSDPRFSRVRVRHELLPLLREIAGGNVTPAIARTAILIAQDTRELDAQAAALLPQMTEEGDLLVAQLQPLTPALRSRVARLWIHHAAGTERKEINQVQLQEVERLVTEWKGQGPVALTGGDRVQRQKNRLRFLPAPAKE